VSIINVNGITNYQRYQQMKARQIIEGMSNRERQHTLDTIKVQQGASNLTSQQYNTTMLCYVEKLLIGDAK